MPKKVSREQMTQNYRRGAANYLFMYLYVLRCGRPPEGWEIGLARSFLTSEVIFLNEPGNEDVKRVYDLALDVERAMGQVETENSKNCFVPCKNEPDEAEAELIVEKIKRSLGG